MALLQVDRQENNEVTAASDLGLRLASHALVLISSTQFEFQALSDCQRLLMLAISRQVPIGWSVRGRALSLALAA